MLLSMDVGQQGSAMYQLAIFGPVVKNVLGMWLLYPKVAQACLSMAGLLPVWVIL
jgi:hypothetical protein